MRRPRIHLATLCTAAQLACAAARPAVAPAPAAPVAAPAPVPRWQLVVLPHRADYLRVGEEPDGAQDVVTGAVRVQVRGDAPPVWARDFPLQNIVAQARTGDDWLFASSDGALFRAGSFTGRLTRVGDTGGHALAGGFASQGVLVARGVDGTLWLGGAQGGFRAAPAGDGAATAAGFVDSSFGLVIVAPGRLLRTLDGGRHTEPVALGPQAAYEVVPGDASAWVRTTGGVVRVERTGPPVPDAAAPERVDPVVPAEALDAIRRGISEGYPAAYATLIADGAPLPDGRVAAFALEDNDLVVYGTQGALARLEAPSDDCEIQPWGAQILAQCRTGEDRRNVLHVSDGVHAFTELRGGGSERTAVASADGTSIVMAGACEPGEELPGEQTPVCWYDGAAWRTRALPPHATLHALWGETLLFQTEDFDDTGTRAETFAVRGGDVASAARVDLDAPDAQLTRVALVGPELVAGTARRGGRVVTAVGALGRPLVTRPVPVGVEAVGFVDDLRALAVGRTLAQLWFTTDGARTWTPLRAPVEGNLAAASLVEPGEGDDDAGADLEVACQPLACYVGSALVWAAPFSPDARAALSPLRMISSTHAPLEVNPADGEFFYDGLQGATWRCEGTARPTAYPPGLLFGPDGWAEATQGARSAATGGAFAVRWGGTDERGRYTASGRAGLLAPVRGAPGATADGPQLSPRVLSRTLAVFERCAGGESHADCDLVAVPRGGAPRVVGALGELLALGDAGVVVQNALPLPDGGAVIHLASEATPALQEVRADVLVRLSARGEVLTRRAFAFGARATTRMLARGPEGAGLVVATEADPRALTFHALDPRAPPRVLPRITSSDVALCSDAAGREVTPGATLVSVSERAYAPALYLGGALITAYYGRALMEFGADAPCLRGLRFWDSDFQGSAEQGVVQEIGGVPRLRAAHGALTGRAVDPRHDGVLSCTTQ